MATEHNHMEENCFRPKPCPRCSLNEAAPDLLKVCENLAAIEDDPHFPEYHSQAMGCGLEDRQITDRYEAMAHGWACAVERISEWIQNETSEPIAKAKGESNG